MAWRALQSSHLNGADYDPDLQALVVQFTNGAMYRSVRPVPPDVVDSFFQSLSAGSYFHDKIKDVYGMVKIADGTTKGGRRSARQWNR